MKEADAPGLAFAEWRRHVRLAEAAALGRHGRLADAEGVVANIPGMAESAPCLDLLARIRIQQGRLREAGVFWRTASALEPENPAYRGASAAAEAWQFRRFGPDRLPLWLAAGAVIVVAILATCMLTAWN